MDFVPPNVTKLSFWNYKLPLYVIESWPLSLTSMQIVGGLDVETFELPETLNCLVCSKLHKLWNRFPQGLEKLIIIQSPNSSLENSTLPNLLVELQVEYCNLRELGILLSRFPCNLRILNFRDNPIKTLSSFQFPPSLEALNLGHCKLTSVDGVVFPSLLKKLYLENNQISNLGDAEFPDLTFLDISKNKIMTMSGVKLPSTLEKLCAEGQVINDWSKTKLPKGLKEWIFETTEEPCTLTIPPVLEIMKIKMREFSEANLSNLTLPGTLYELQCSTD